MLESFRLRVFRSVAHHLNFSRAAEELLLTQPAVTQQIKALEDEFGVPLFEREGGRIALSAGGKALLPFAEAVQDLSDQATEAVAGAVGQRAGRLVLGASQTIAQYLLPAFIAGFRRIHPGVAVSASSGNSRQMIEALFERRIEMALIEAPERRKDLRIEPFMTDEMELIVPAAHPWADTEIPPEVLKDEPLLMRELGSGTRRVIELGLSRAGLKKKALPISMELDSTEGLLSAVEAGLGVTFVSRWAVRHQLALGILKLSRVRGLKLVRRFSMVFPAGPIPGGNVGSFRAYVHSRAAEMSPVAQPARTAR